MNKKLHILFLCSWYPSDEFPTNGDFIERHAKALSSIHKVSVLHIVSSNKNRITKDDITENLSIHIAYVKHTNNSVTKLFKFLKAYKSIIRSLESIDVIHLNVLYPFGVLALYQKMFYKTPYIISEHWTGYIRAIKMSQLQKLISKSIASNAAAICPVSNTLQHGMIRYGLKGNYSVIGNVVDTQIFKPNSSNNNSFTIVHVSSLNDHQKNITGILKAAKELERETINFSWKFIGGSSNKYDSYIKLLNFKSTNIEFINHISQEELAIQLQHADICVSFSNYETFGLVMTEAIACGTYVISTDTGILNEIESQDYFTIIKRNDTSSLKKAIMNYYNANKKLNEENMHSFIDQKFSTRSIASSFDAVYKQAIKLNN